jgi:class 3 adenylate cyclase
MQCPRCQFDNLGEALFCIECGAALRATCAACQTANPPSAKYCGHCGRRLGGPPPRPAAPEPYTPPHLVEKVLRSRSALEGERKQVTVLFADVKGSLELAGRVDAERWHRIMDRFFAILAAGVHRFEGTVNQYTGDGIMALFGAPIAHEDHAQRACLAALHLREDLRSYGQALRREYGFDFAVRMGINSGEVVVGTIGPGLRMDYTAQGHTVGLAARMEQIAEAGAVYVTEQTAALVAGFFDLENLGAFKLHSVPEPVCVFALRGLGPLRTRLELSRARGFAAFVGRTEEMALLDASLAQARAGAGAVVGISGDAGVGKSRLCLEFVERCRAQGLAVHEGHCPAHGKTIPFLLLRDLLRSTLGLDERSGTEEARRRIAGALVLLDERLQEGLPLLFDFLGLADPERRAPVLDPEARCEAVIDLACRLVRAHGERQPLALLIDDLHWIDAESERFVERLVDGVAGTPTLLIVNFRPEYRAAWMDQLADTPGRAFRQLALAPPDAPAVRALLRELLGDHPSLGTLPQLVHERTGGNPFFIEEVVRSLIEQGILTRVEPSDTDASEALRPAPPYALARAVTEIQIPATVQAIVGARIDRLNEAEKQALQAAAVIGKTFAAAVLERALGVAGDELAGALEVLRRAALIDGDPLAPERAHTFRHPLVQEVAYQSQLVEQRGRRHVAVARALEELHADTLGQHAALIAHHYEAAHYRYAAARWRRRALLNVTQIQVPRRREAKTAR